MNRWLTALGVGVIVSAVVACLALKAHFDRYIDATAWDYMLIGLIWAPFFVLGGAFLASGLLRSE